jgi:RNA polymerase sigma-70 factor (ECF subfamily)
MFRLHRGGRVEWEVDLHLHAGERLPFPVIQGVAPVAEDSTTQLQGLIDRLLLGDEQAHDELIDRAYQRLLRLARKKFKSFERVRPLADTGDVLHGSLTGLRQALRAKPPTSVVEFFSLAAKHLRWELLDLAKSIDREERPDWQHDTSGQADSSVNTPPIERVAASSDSPSVLAFWTEFHEAVEALPEMDRIVFELLHYHDVRQVEAASLLKVDERTIRRHWLAAKRRLGAFLRRAEEA